MSSESLTDDELKARLNDEGVTISPSARNQLQNVDDLDPVLDALIADYQSRVMVTASDINELLADLDVELTDAADNDETAEDTTDSDGDTTPDATDESTESGGKGDTGDPSEEDGDEDEDEDEPSLKEKFGFRPKVRGHAVKRVTNHTADTTEEFDKDNPNLDDPFDAIDVHADGKWPDRDTDQRDITIEKDITGKSKSSGDIGDFAALFQSRYQKLADILKDRVTPREIGSLTEEAAQRLGGDETIAIIGMVNEVRTTRNNNRLLELEDDTGETMRVVFTDDEQIEECDTIMHDEVIAVEGQLADDAGIIFGDRLHFPEIPPRRTPNTADRSVKAAMVSDIHFGAREFAADKWNAFVEWIGEQPDIEYMLVAGDIIEGVGIYAGQQEELAVPNLQRQYELCAHAFDQLPNDLDIIVIPGNHDGVRLAEPQPMFDEDVRELFGDNVHWGGNPGRITLEGVTFLLYHGVALNPIIDNLPDGDIQHPFSAMWPMLQKRHVAPLYGEGARIAPEHEDYLVIEEVPDVFHTGHVHTFDIGEYNGVKAVNTGTWQHQTKYQIDLDVDPDVGYCPVVDLGDLSVDIYAF